MHSISTKVISFFVFSNLYIALVAAIAAIFSLHFFGIEKNIFLIFFIFWATLSAYSFHWYLSVDDNVDGSRQKWTNSNSEVLVGLFILSLTFTVYFFFQLEYAMPLAMLCGGLTLLYSLPKINRRPFIWLRKLAIGKTIYLSLVWILVTVFLPFALVDEPVSTKQLFFAANRFFLVFPICVLFDRKDRESDLGQGIRNFIYYMSSLQIGVLLFICFLLFIFCGLVVLDFNLISISSFELFLPGFVFLAVAPFHRKQIGDLFYYLLLDGLIMLSGLISILIEYFSS